MFCCFFATGNSTVLEPRGSSVIVFDHVVGFLSVPSSLSHYATLLLDIASFVFARLVLLPKEMQLLLSVNFYSS